jgi:hypothetical protein
VLIAKLVTASAVALRARKCCLGSWLRKGRPPTLHTGSRSSRNGLALYMCLFVIFINNSQGPEKYNTIC